MDINPIVIGVVFIVANATMIGLTVERHARAMAWRRVAEERRWNWEQRRLGAGENPNAANPVQLPT